MNVWCLPGLVEPRLSISMAAGGRIISLAAILHTYTTEEGMDVLAVVEMCLKWMELQC